MREFFQSFRQIVRITLAANKALLRLFAVYYVAYAVYAVSPPLNFTLLGEKLSLQGVTAYLLLISVLVFIGSTLAGRQKSNPLLGGYLHLMPVSRSSLIFTEALAFAVSSMVFILSALLLLGTTALKNRPEQSAQLAQSIAERGLLVFTGRFLTVLREAFLLPSLLVGLWLFAMCILLMAMLHYRKKIFGSTSSYAFFNSPSKTEQGFLSATVFVPAAALVLSAWALDSQSEFWQARTAFQYARWILWVGSTSIFLFCVFQWHSIRALYLQKPIRRHQAQGLALVLGLSTVLVAPAYTNYFKSQAIAHARKESPVPIVFKSYMCLPTTTEDFSDLRGKIEWASAVHHNFLECYRFGEINSLTGPLESIAAALRSTPELSPERLEKWLTRAADQDKKGFYKLLADIMATSFPKHAVKSYEEKLVDLHCKGLRPTSRAYDDLVEHSKLPEIIDYADKNNCLRVSELLRKGLRNIDRLSGERRLAADGSR